MNEERLAKFAKMVRDERKLYPTRTAFCKAVGITRTTLRALESGKQQPTDETIEKLAPVMHKTPEELRGEGPIKSDDHLLRDLDVEALLFANQFRRAPAEAKHAAKAFLSQKIADDLRVRIAEVILVLLQREDILGSMEGYLAEWATPQDATPTATEPSRPALAPIGRKKRRS
jgi:transcriptional regulator with XRE-family HTH domain